jgi:hypothetical protein
LPLLAFTDLIGACRAIAVALQLSVDVTGALLFTEGRFVQVLEGERDKVREIFDRIGADARHADIKILSAQYSDRRRFQD